MEYSFDMSKSMESTINQSLYEWRTFQDDCNKLMSQPNMLNNNDSLNAQSGTNDGIQAFEDLFRENIGLLYNDVTNASMHHERLSPEYLENLEIRHEDLVCRTRDVLVEQLPYLASEADSRLSSIRALLNKICDSINSSPIVHDGHASIQGFRKWLQVKSDMLNDMEHVLNGEFSLDDKDQFLIHQKILQDEIDKQGRILLEACRKDLFGSPMHPTLEDIASRNLELSEEKSGTSTTGYYEKKKRIFCSLENRWKRLRLQALECTVRLDAFFGHDQNQFLRPNSSISSYEPPNKRSRANNDSILLLANELLVMKSSTPKEVVENRRLKLAEWNNFVPLNNDASPLIDADLDYEPVMNDSDDFNVDLADNPVCKYANSCGAECTIVVNSCEMRGKDRTVPVAPNSLDLPGISSAMDSSQTSDSLIDNGYSSGENHLPRLLGKDSDKVQKCRQVDQKLNLISLSDDYSHRIESSPVRDYYKMLPDEDLLLLENPGTSTSEKTNNWLENFSCTRADWENNDNNVEKTTAKNDDHKQLISAEMTDSMVVNVSHSKENLAQENLSQILSMMDESYDEFPHKADYANRLATTLDEKMRELFNYNRGTTWRPFAGSSLTNRSSLKVRADFLKKARDSENDRTSNDAGSELSTEEENHNIQFDKELSRQKSLNLSSNVRSKKRPLDNRMETTWHSELALSVSAVPDTPIIRLRKTSINSHPSPKHRLSAPIMPDFCSPIIASPSRRDLIRHDYTFSPSNNDAPSIASDSSDSERLSSTPGSVKSEYEWDDYKPPAHCEAGQLENRLDDSLLTQFGDDYRSWIGSVPVSARSEEVELPSLTEGMRTSFHKELPAVTRKLKRRLNWMKRISSQNNIDPISKNSHYKRCRHAIDTLKSYMNKIKENNMIVDPLILKTVEDLMISWENELNRHHQANPCGDVDAIKDSIKQLAASLQCFQEKLLNASSDDPESSIEETLKKIEELKELRNKILTARKKLDSCESCPDLANLDACCQDASDKCEVELRSLEELKTVLQDWKDNENDFRDLSFRLRERLADCGSFDSLLDGSSSFCSSREPERSNSNFEDFKAIRDDIKRCEERLERLENAYNKLAKVQSNELTLKDDLLDECRRQLEEYRKQLNDLTKKSPCSRPTINNPDSLLNDFEIIPPSTCSSNLPSIDFDFISLPSLSKNEHELNNDLDKSGREEEEDIFAAKQEWKNSTKTAKKRRKSKEKEAQLVDIVEKQRKLQPARSAVPSTSRSFRRTLLYFLPLPVCLLFLLIGLSVFEPDLAGCKSTKFFWHSGFRLDYINGPPPT